MTDADQRAVSLQALIDNSNQQNSAQKLLKIALTDDRFDSVSNLPFQQLRLDSRQVAENDVFVLLKSQNSDCQQSYYYLDQAAKHAAFVLSEIESSILFASTSSTESIAAPSLSTLACPIIYVPNIRDFLGDLVQARLQYQQPNPLPTVVAVTGTNGKTTVSQLVAQLAQLATIDSAVMGTAGNGKLGELIQASHTTGDALAVQQFLHQMSASSVALLALEASSHGLDQQRLQGVPIKVAIYTNLSRDHLDYHPTMADYVAAKAKLFDRHHFPSLTHAIINIDDDYAPMILEVAKNSGLIVWTYSLQATVQATFTAVNIQPSLQGVEMTIQSEFGDIDIVSPLLGRFNVANLLAAIAATVALGIEMPRSCSLVPQLQGAVGRMQRVPSKEGCFIVDYAHTPDALSQVLASLRAHCRGTLWAVFGCGGDRDAGKRPLMAQAGLVGADRVILTADNPRTENPETILQDMQAGMSATQFERTHIELSRKLAIEYAVTHATENDIVVIAGKGHETYQEIDGVRYDFDDSIILQQALSKTGRF